ncbi:MAG: hypothetical protein J1G01_03530 [Clostridiales bacterium]|nr:hypothetical protein [Clostridiales bacterium]
MAFKNAFKNLITHFGIVWALLLYIVICTAIIVGLSLPFILPIAQAFGEAGVFDGIGNAFSSLFNEGGWNGFWDELYGVYAAIVGVFENNGRVKSLTMFFLIFIVILAFRFLFGLYEIPLATVLDGRLSCNAQYGFGGKFFSTLSVSVRYTLARMPITILFDGLMYGAIYGLSMAIGINVALPFVVIAVILVFTAFKRSLLACWAPCIVDGTGVVRGFLRSCEICFKRFGSIYSTYFVVELLMLACGLFLLVFTLGVGLVVAVPFAVACMSYLNSTEFYNKTGKRYYIDSNVFTPPTENVL